MRICDENNVISAGLSPNSISNLDLATDFDDLRHEDANDLEMAAIGGNFAMALARMNLPMTNWSLANFGVRSILHLFDVELAALKNLGTMVAMKTNLSLPSRDVATMMPLLVLIR